MRRAADCIERSYFRESRLGVNRCFYRLGVGWWVYKIEMVLRTERERDHHPATLILKIEGGTEREGPPPTHPHLKDRRRDSERENERERDHHPTTLT